MRKITLIFATLCLLPISAFSATIPQGGVFKFTEPDGGGGAAQPLDMPLALPVANFFGYAVSGNSYYYDEKSSSPIAVNIMYIESDDMQIPASRLPEITDDNYDFSQHYLHYASGDKYSWVSGGKEGDWGLPVINAKPYTKNDPFPAITACSGTPATLKEQRYKCKPGMTSGSRTLSLYDELLDVATKQNKTLWVGTLVFPRASAGPEGSTSNIGTGGEGHELVVYLPHRHMSLIHVEAILLEGTSGMHQVLTAWTLKSNDGENFTYYKGPEGNNQSHYPAPAFVSTGNPAAFNGFMGIGLLNQYENESVPVTEVAAIHTRIGGGLEWTSLWYDALGWARGGDIFMCMNGVKGENSIDDYTDLLNFEYPDYFLKTIIKQQKRYSLPEGRKGFRFEEMFDKPPTSNNAYICDTKGTQLFSSRLRVYTPTGGPDTATDFMELHTDVTPR